MQESVVLGSGLQGFLVSTRFHKRESDPVHLCPHSIERAVGIQLSWLGCTALLCGQETRCDALSQWRFGRRAE